MSFRPEDFELTWNWGSSLPVDIGDWLKIYVTVNVRKDYDLKGCYIAMENKDHFQSTLEYLKDQKQVTLTLKPWATSSILTLKQLTISLKDSKGTVLKTIYPHLKMSNFTGSLYPAVKIQKGKERLTNILLFGLMGSAKSSFINSCYTLVRSQNDKIVTDIALAGGSTTHVTTSVRAYRLVDIDSKKPTPFRLWDTWGLDRNNYSDCEFEALLGGQIPAKDFKMNDDFTQLRFDPGNFEERKIDCIIFFIPVGEVAIMTSDLLPRTQSFIEKATRLGVRIVIALSKVDSICPNIRSNSCDSSSQVATHIKKLSNLLNLAENKIIPLINYQKETSKNFEVDRSVFSVLQAAVRATEGCLSDDVLDLINS